MAFQAPMGLLRDGEPFGTLVTYGYETPWATARLVARDAAAQAVCERVCAFLAWVEELPDDLPDEEADAAYERECAARGLDEATITRCHSARWVVVTADGSQHPAYALSFDEGGFVSWRW